MYKKIISSILAVFVMFSLAGCAEEDSSTVAVAADAEVVEEEKNKKRDIVSVQIKDDEKLLDDNQKELLHSYGIAYAETVKNLQTTDISPFYADAESEEYYINRTAFDTLVAVRSLSSNDLSLEYISVDYRVESVTELGIP